MTATGDEYSWDVFISYSHRDGDWVREWLLPAIESAGMHACIDYRDFGIGTPSVINMEQAVEHSRKTLLVLTPAYVTSEWCKYESLMRQTLDPANSSLGMIPVLHIPTELPTRLALFTYLPLRDPAECEANLPRLLDALRAGGPLVGERPDTPPPWPPRICLLPPAGTVPAWFVPRPEEADKVLRALGVLGESGDKIVAMTAVHGMGGVGKTTLAAWLLRDDRVRRRWPDGVLWATLGPDATGEAAADAPLLLWGAALGEKGLHDYPRTEDKAAIVRRLLAGRRVLLVVDDAWDIAPARLLLDCAGPDCGRLLTTRLWDVAAELDQDPLRIDVMAPAEALDLLTERAGKQAMQRLTPEEASELCQRLGCLPLALNLAGAGLLGEATVGEYLEPLRREQGLGLLELGDGRRREQSLRVCFDISVNHLPDEDRSRYALLGILASGAPFGAVEAAIVWGQQPSDPAIPRLLRRLAHHALLDPVDDNAPRYRQHALTREHALKVLDPIQRQAAKERHTAGFLALAREYHERRAWLAFDPLYAQALAALERARKDSEDRSLPDGVRDVTRRIVSDYVLALFEYWNVRGLLTTCREWTRKAAEYCEFLGLPFEESLHLGNLGNSYRNQGEIRQAIETYGQSLSIIRKIGNRTVEGNLLGNLGNAHRSLGDVHISIDYYQQTLGIAQEIGNLQMEGSVLCCLGNAYADLGDMQPAIEHYSHALSIARRTGDRKGEGIPLCNLGIAYADLGETRRAIECYEEALAIDRNTGYRYVETHELYNLANAYVDIGQAERGRECAEQAIAIAQEIGNQLVEGWSIGSLGYAWVALGEIVKGMNCYGQALAIAREMEDPRLEGETLGHIGKAYTVMSDLPRAAEYHTQAAALWQRLGDRLSEAKQRELLGLALKGQSDLAQAREQFAAALALFEAVEAPQAEQARRELATLE